MALAHLIKFARELRKIDASLSIPYWDWDNDQGRLIGVRNYLALSGGRNLGLPMGVAEDPASNPPDRAWFSSENLTEQFEALDAQYYTFAINLERLTHDRGHVWIGGDMGRMISPSDIIFWMHHAAVDRVWAKWQETHSDDFANLSAGEARLDPWSNEFNVENVNDIADLGEDSYSYEDPVRPAPIATPLADFIS